MLTGCNYTTDCAFWTDCSYKDSYTKEDEEAYDESQNAKRQEVIDILKGENNKENDTQQTYSPTDES